MLRTHDISERGFVLATALIMLSLLSLMAIAMFFTGRASIHVSSGAQHSTEGHYFAETAVNYMIWAMRNDAEFDSYDYGIGGFPEPASPITAANVGDWTELMDNLSHPGPTVISDSTISLALGRVGQVKYLDNTPLNSRELVWPLPTTGSPPNVETVYPTLYNINTNLPRYIQLDIDANGNVTPSIPALIAGLNSDTMDVPPYHNVADVPNNGAIAWLTTGNSAEDFELDTNLALCTGTVPPGAVACASTGEWLSTTGSIPGTLAAGTLHGIVVYAIGYVGGRPSSIIRAQIK